MTDTTFEGHILSDFDEVTVEDMEMFLVDSSRGLVEVARDAGSTVRFIHDSVRDYLEQTRLEHFKLDNSESLDPICHDRLKGCCQRYVSSCGSFLLHSSTDGLKESLSGRRADMQMLRNRTRQMHPFLDYALEGMVHHADVAQSLGVSQESYVAAFPSSLWCRLHNLIANYHNERLGQTASSEYIFVIKGAVNLVRIMTQRIRLIADWDRDLSSEQYPTLLGAAMDLSDHKMFDLLLERGANPDSRTEDNRTCLSVATDRGDLRAVRGLVAAGAAIYDNRLDTNAMYPHAIHTAVIRSESKTVEILLANLKYATRWHPSYTEAIQLASLNSDTKIFRAFLDQMDTAIESYQKREACLSEISTLKSLCQSILDLACCRCDDDIAQVLLERGVRPSTAAIAAVSSQGNLKIRQMLLERGISIEEQGTQETLVLQDKTARGKNSNTLRPDSNGYIRVASSRSHDEILRMLSPKAADVEAADRPFQKSLWLACSNSDHKIVRSLLSQNPDAKLQIQSHFTALQIACLNGYDKVVHVLLGYGADVNAQNSFGYTPIYSAAMQGHENIVHMLLRRDVWRKHLDTALQAAFSSGYFEIVKTLFEKGARSSKQNCIGVEAHANTREQDLRHDEKLQRNR